MTTDTRPQALIVMGADPFSQQFDQDRLRRLGELTRLGTPVWTDDLDDPAVAARLAEVEVILTGWGAPSLTAERLARMPRLRAMFHCAGTIRHLVSDEFWRRGILASNVAEANALPVAEFTLAAVIFAGKKAPFVAADAKEARGDRSRVAAFGPLSNLGLTVGVVGFSKVGRRVTGLLQQLESLTCLVADPYADADEVAAAGGTLVELDDLLPRVDVLSLHAPQLPTTHHMIAAPQLAALRDHTTVLNTARGSLIDTAALERECASGRLNAVLDVTDPEPLPAASVLYDLPNVMITPHIAGSLGSEVLRLSDAALDELERYVDDEPLIAGLSSDDLTLSA